jgi:hypothetical protein
VATTNSATANDAQNHDTYSSTRKEALCPRAV